MNTFQSTIQMFREASREAGMFISAFIQADYYIW